MKVACTIKSESLSELRSNLGHAIGFMEAMADQSLQGVSEEAFKMALNRTPRRTGALAASARLTENNQGSVKQRIISYGDATVNPETGEQTEHYAVQVHEKFNPAAPESYKWLELALHEFGQERFVNGLAQRLRARI